MEERRKNSVFFWILSGVGVLTLFGGVGFFLFTKPRVTMVLPLYGAALPSVPEQEISTSSLPVSGDSSRDLARQARLTAPPKEVNGIYLTSWSAGSAGRVKATLSLIEKTGLNAVVIDVKDYSGIMAYRTDVPEIQKTGAESAPRIRRPNALIKEFHDRNIYVIGRVSVFQDPVLASAHPEWAPRNKTTGKTWKDKKGLSWMDPAATGVWSYNALIAKDALSRGFDEINFDYIRFPSDGDLEAVEYPFFDEATTQRHVVIRDFFAYLRKNLEGEKISADIFGLATVERHDLGIGQIFEDAVPFFDYISPMVYPSHYGRGFLGYRNPAEHPYEVVTYSMEQARERLNAYESETMNHESRDANNASGTTLHDSGFKIHVSRLRPWLQVFDLGATYTSSMIEKQIQAVEDVLCRPAPSRLENDTTSLMTFVGTEKGRGAQICDSSAGSLGDKFGGWLLWDPYNTYNNYQGNTLINEANP